MRHHGLDDGTVGAPTSAPASAPSRGRLTPPGATTSPGADGRAEVRGAEHIRYEVFLGEGVGFSGMRGLDALDREPVRDDVDRDGRSRKLGGERP